MGNLSKEKKETIILAVLFISLIIISGCASQESQPSAPAVCGNNVVDSGEECDNSACTAMKTCSQECQCEDLVPPPIPE